MSKEQGYPPQPPLPQDLQDTPCPTATYGEQGYPHQPPLPSDLQETPCHSWAGRALESRSATAAPHPVIEPSVQAAHCSTEVGMAAITCPGSVFQLLSPPPLDLRQTPAAPCSSKEPGSPEVTPTPLTPTDPDWPGSPASAGAAETSVDASRLSRSPESENAQLLPSPLATLPAGNSIAHARILAVKTATSVAAPSLLAVPGRPSTPSPKEVALVALCGLKGHKHAEEAWSRRFPELSLERLCKRPRFDRLDTSLAALSASELEDYIIRQPLKPCKRQRPAVSHNRAVGPFGAFHRLVVLYKAALRCAERQDDCMVDCVT